MPGGWWGKVADVGEVTELGSGGSGMAGGGDGRDVTEAEALLRILEFERVRSGACWWSSRSCACARSQYGAEVHGWKLDIPVAALFGVGRLQVVSREYSSEFDCW